MEIEKKKDQNVNFLMSYLIYVLVFLGTILLSIITINHPYSKVIAQSWPLTFLCLGMPLQSASIAFLKKILILLPLLGFSFWVQTFIAYKIRGYVPSSDISIFEIIISIVFYLILSYSVGLAVTLVTKRNFSIWGP